MVRCRGGATTIGGDLSNAPKKRKQSGTQARLAQPKANETRVNTKVVGAIVGGLALIAAIVIVVVLLSSGDSEGPEALSFNGTALPEFVAGVDDPAFGTKAPLFQTEYLDGEFAFVGGGGGPNDTAKLVMFVAHWCPTCQAEVPAVADWVAENGLPEGVEIVMVSTFPDSDRDNYPPSAWFEEAGWEAPVAADSGDGEIAEWFGMTSVPSWAVITELNFVLERGVGAIPPSELDRLIGLAAASR